MANNDLPITIRNLLGGDVNFILSSWTKTARYLSPQNILIPDGLIFFELANAIKKIVWNKPCLFTIACDEANPAVMYGWRCGDSESTHFVFVKKEFRNFGVGTILTEDNWIFSNWSNYCEYIPKIKYKPHAWERLINEINQINSGPAENTYIHTRQDIQHIGTGRRKGKNVSGLFTR